MKMAPEGPIIESSNNQLESFRPVGHFPPTIWADCLASLSSDYSTIQGYALEIEKIKQEVRERLMNTTTKSTEKVNLINTIGHLGLSYHFEKEIEQQLELIFHAHKFEEAENSDLCTISLVFRVLRQHGYKMSCNMFNKFKDSAGKFKETLTNDARGMLSLYEATHLRIRGEDILDEALNFTTAHLKSMRTPSSSLAKQILQALKRPFHIRMPRVEARHYIHVYESEESREETLLRLAKLDFNQVQRLHQQELRGILRWWMDLDVPTKLSYAKDRVVECFFWAVGVYFEPHYSLARVILTKVLAITSVIDDTYDAYGTIAELRLFTDAVERWDISAINQLPECMKVLYRSLLNLFEEFEELMTKEGRGYSVYHAKEAMKEQVRNYHEEAEWFNSGYVPSFDERMRNALASSGYHLLAITSFVGMGNIATEYAFDWIQNKPKIVRASEMIARLTGDMTCFKAEQKRGHVVSSIECYMKEYGVPEEVAMDKVQEMIVNAWGEMNEECFKPTTVSMHLLMRILNLARVIDVVYKYEDGYTYSANVLKDDIELLFINSILV